MAKMKTHSASKKRFKVTASGKIKRSKAYNRHHFWAKSPKKIRALRQADYISGADEKRIIRLLPYA
ncbi:50S ribosomal protein L35 [Candidatus Babeliales bacterium]|nr:50S ribosomal protein L35 [Candidatus Babeliales bacterium]MCF7899427.1 50S ribosomal protein L35 [Candidatus Babeliales bacterium]